MSVTNIAHLPPELDATLRNKYRNENKKLFNCYQIGNGYFSDVYAWNRNYDYIIKWYNNNISEDNTVLHLPDHILLSELADLAAVPDLIAYSDKFCVMTRAKGTPLESCRAEHLAEHRETILSTVGHVANRALKAGFLMNDINLGNVTLDYHAGNVYVIDFNAYIEVDYRFDAFKGLNASTSLFSRYSMDIMSEKAMELYLIDTLDRFTDLLDNKIMGALQ